MRNIYGNRSIIPNNYYFTFDKIYANLSDIESNHGDTVLIGRTVLCQQDHTVWLKTVNGYIRVAKLDNEGRFKFLEGYPLTDIHNIDDLTGLGDSPNGNGTYLVNYDKGVQGTYPSIRGIKNSEDEKSNYLPGITFLLNQYSETFLPETAYQKITSEDNFSKTQTYYILDEKGNYIQQVYTEIEYNTALENNIEIFIKSPIQVKVYQIMTDISSGLKDKQDDDSKREKLYHNNKTFTRQCLYMYEIASGDIDKTKKYYKYDVYENGFQEVINPNVTNGYYTRELSTNWSDWDDLSEQYIGYIGDLGSDNTRRENINNATTLVEATNILDKLIGKGSRLNKVQSVQTDALDADDLSEDIRQYKLEDNIIDALSRISADIGDLSLLSGNEQINNLGFSNTTLSENLKEYSPTKHLTVNSLVDIIILLSTIIGDRTLLAEGHTKYPIKADNIIDALLEHDSQIGELNKLRDNSNQINKENLVLSINRLDELLGLLSSITAEKNNLNDATSFANAIIQLNQLLGNEANLKTYKEIINDEGDITGHSGIKANTVIGALVEHDQEIGELADLSQTNNPLTKNNLVDTINQLDSFLGVIRNIQTEPENILSDTLSDAIVQLDKQISALKQNIKGLEDYNLIQDSNISFQGTQIQDLYQYLMGDSESERIEDFSAEGIISLSGLVNKLNTNVNQQTNNLDNLAENVNYMDSTIADLANQINAGGTTSGFNWGSF